jgi:Recombinase
MARRRLRRKSAKARRHADPLSALFDEFVESAPPERAIVGEHVEQPAMRAADRVERLAYTRTQAAAALGVSPATFARRVLPLIETIEMPWGTELVPADELERLVAEHRRPPRGRGRTRPRARRPATPEDVAGRIAADQHAGKSLGQIARELNADGVPTAQGGSQWWPSTVRVVLKRTGTRAGGRRSQDHVGKPGRDPQRRARGAESA